jgi:hypothetical protein
MQVPVGHGHRKGVRRWGSHDIYSYMYTKDGGEVSLEGARVVWLQSQRQLLNCAAALELISISRTAKAALELHSSSRTAEDGGEVSLESARVVWLQLQRQLSNCAAALELTTSSRTAKVALKLHRQCSNLNRQLSNCYRGALTEVHLEGARVVCLQPLRTECARGVCLICQMCV